MANGIVGDVSKKRKAPRHVLSETNKNKGASNAFVVVVPYGYNVGTAQPLEASHEVRSTSYRISENGTARLTWYFCTTVEL
jgi:hypothetical protein